MNEINIKQSFITSILFLNNFFSCKCQDSYFECFHFNLFFMMLSFNQENNKYIK